MEQAFEHYWEDENLGSQPDSAREILRTAGVLKEQLKEALRRYYTAQRQLEVKTIDTPEDEVNAIIEDILIVLADCKEEVARLIEEISSQLEFLRKQYDSDSLKTTNDFLDVLILEQTIIEGRGAIQTIPSSDNSNMV